MVSAADWDFEGLAGKMIEISIHLAWISSDFLLDESKTFLDACGVVLGNTLSMPWPRSSLGEVFTPSCGVIALPR